MYTVIRHIFFYTESKGLKLIDISDELFMEFLTTEMPTTNKRIIGRTLRGIRYVSSYCKRAKTLVINCHVAFSRVSDILIKSA